MLVVHNVLYNLLSHSYSFALSTVKLLYDQVIHSMVNNKSHPEIVTNVPVVVDPVMASR